MAMGASAIFPTSLSWSGVSADILVRLQSEAQRRLGRQWPMPGYNYYVQVDVGRARRGLSPADVPPGRL